MTGFSRRILSRIDAQGWRGLLTSQLHIKVFFSFHFISLSLVRIAGHPLAQNERCLHMFLQEANIDRNYVPGKIRNT